jgi:hypothetical protein
MEKIGMKYLQDKEKHEQMLSFYCIEEHDFSSEIANES